MSSELNEVWDAALRRVFATGRPEKLEFAFPAPDGTRYFDCQLVPEPEPGGAIPSVLSVARDVTDRWLMYEAERRARTIAEALRDATVVLTRCLDRETVLVNLLDRLRRMVPFDHASVMLLEEAWRVSVRAVFDGDRVVPLTPEARSEFNPTDHPIVHGILTTGAPLLIPDVRAHPDWSLPTDRSYEASAIRVPLFARGDVAGLISVIVNYGGTFILVFQAVLPHALVMSVALVLELGVLFLADDPEANCAREKRGGRKQVIGAEPF